MLAPLLFLNKTIYIFFETVHFNKMIRSMLTAEVCATCLVVADEIFHRWHQANKLDDEISCPLQLVC